MSTKITEMKDSGYILTSDGEKYYESLQPKVESSLIRRQLPNNKWRKATNLDYTLYRRDILLRRIIEGRPILEPESKEYPGKTRMANQANEKELAKMVKANLVRKVQ